MAFAQKEMVETFMEGIDPYYRQFLDGFLGELFGRIADRIASVVPSRDRRTRTEAGEKLRNFCTKLLADLKEQAGDYRREHHVDPIIEAVAFLPKDELAAMAESLVNLTSFKRRISLDAETVGGPIDVAVISKGDGFIWIKRKHYFEPKLNPAFFANYYLGKEPIVPKGDQDAKGEKDKEEVRNV